MFAAGTCGDINHFNYRLTKDKQNKTDYIGNTLAETVKAKVPKLKKIAKPCLDVRSVIVDAPLQKYSAEELAWGH